MKKTLKPDSLLKEFWQDNEHFADVYNATMFHGKPVLSPDQLTEQDSALSVSSVGKNRDLLQKFEYGTEFILLGIENQQEIHYAMPLRTMMYDAEGYTKEYQTLARQYRKDCPKRTSAEFLSSISKDTRLHPIITLVIYYGKEPWTGPFSLEDMLIPIPEELKPYFNDYKLNLFQVRESDQYKFQNSDVRIVMDLSRALLMGDKNSITETYHNKTISRDLVAVVGGITKSKKIMKLATDIEKEEVHMCVIEDWMEESRKEGWSTGWSDGRASGWSDGRASGWSDGVLEGQSVLIQRLFQSGMNLEEIARISELSQETLLEIQSNISS